MDPSAGPLADASLTLLERARAGDRDALGRLLDRHVPRLRRWARGRLPLWARDLGDTEDAVQDAVMRSVGRIEAADLPNEGALHAYLRQAVLNRIRDEMRRAGRRPPSDTLDESLADPATSPLDRTIGVQAVARYEAALMALRPADREAVIARVEMGLSYDELAAAMGKPTANAARVSVARALVRLAEEMQRGR